MGAVEGGLQGRRGTAAAGGRDAQRVRSPRAPKGGPHNRPLCLVCFVCVCSPPPDQAGGGAEDDGGGLPQVSPGADRGCWGGSFSGPAAACCWLRLLAAHAAGCAGCWLPACCRARLGPGPAPARVREPAALTPPLSCRPAPPRPPGGCTLRRRRRELVALRICTAQPAPHRRRSGAKNAVGGPSPRGAGATPFHLPSLLPLPIPCSPSRQPLLHLSMSLRRSTCHCDCRCVTRFSRR